MYPQFFLHYHILYNITVVKRRFEIICVSTLYIFFHVALPKPKDFFFFFHFFLIHSFTSSSSSYFPFLLLSSTHTHTHTQVSLSLSLSLPLSTPYFPFIKNSTEFKRFFEIRYVRCK